MGIATVRKWQTTFQRPNSTLCSTKPRVQRGPTQEEIDAIVQRQIDATKDKVADLQARIAAMSARVATATANATEFDPNLFGLRIYKCLAGKSAKTDFTADASSPDKDDKNT